MHSNRLAREKSPYLLQHAHNPVDWYPWGPEAFEKARSEDKPIFLSVGYSTCHWCHVMERESFENDSIALLLNRDFVPVKVDREERPDVDRIYMAFVQATSGGGGWPMSVFLTPDLEPFFGGTYFPPESGYGRPGFSTVLERIADAWRTQRDELIRSAGDVVSQLRQHLESAGGAGLDATVLDSCFYALRRGFDSRNGGFGGAPKFPRPVAHNFLLRYWVRTEKPEALDMVLETLRAMAKGGIHDHLGGGFHRYSVDDHWFVPHFEKMLYDQAQLAVSYLEAFQITGDDYHARVAAGILDYVLRDLRSPGGGFYSAEDADSAIDPARPAVKAEGAFYLWTRSEIEQVLGSPDAETFCRWYGVEQGGNVSEDPHGEFTGKNILFEAAPPDASVAAMRARLLEVRARRPRPHLDDKILAAWNGLAISAFAKAGSVLDQPRYLDAARAAAEFVLAGMYRPEAGILLRRFRDGEAAIEGFLDDYAFFAQALLDLYEADFEVRYFEIALRLCERALALFEDHDAGGFFSTTEDDGELILRLKDDYDGAEPAGNSVMILNLLRLAGITGRQDLRRAADRALEALGRRVAEAPVGAPQLLVAYEYTIAKHQQIVVTGRKQQADTRVMLGVAHKRFLPNSIVILLDPDEAHRLDAYQPALAGIPRGGGAATGYVCEDFTCQLPVSDPAKFAELLK